MKRYKRSRVALWWFKVRFKFWNKTSQILQTIRDNLDPERNLKLRDFVSQILKFVRKPLHNLKEYAFSWDERLALGRNFEIEIWGK